MELNNRYHYQTALLLITSLLLCRSAIAIEPVKTVGVQLGFDLQYRSQTFNKERGERLFKKHAFQLSPYTSYVGEVFGGELGVTHLTPASRSTSHSPPNSLLEETLVATEEHNARLKIDGWYATLLRKQPIPVDHTTLHLAGGLSHLVFRAEDHRYSPTTFSRKFTKSKFVPRLEIGLEYQKESPLGIRWRLIWENTKRFKITNGNAIVQAKNQYIHSLGLFYAF